MDMPIPDVDHYTDFKSLQEVHAICEAYVEKEQKPCSVVTIADEVCYAYMDLKGHSDTVQCFVRLPATEE